MAKNWTEFGILFYKKLRSRKSQYQQTTTLIRVIIIILSYSTVFSDSNITSSGGGRASTPPRGWNSYDSFGWTITEEQFLQNAYIVSQKLLPSGYEYVVVDYLWYRVHSQNSSSDSLGFDKIDEWGRVIPDPGRWPSSIGGKGFTEISRTVHSMGLKFGIHVMRGISTQAVNSNTPILDTTTGKAYVESGKVWSAADIGLSGAGCSWMPHGFMSVNTTFGASIAFLRSLYLQYSQWGVDFVKHDCVFGHDFDLAEIQSVSDILRVLEPPIVYSISPGTNVVPDMGKKVNRFVNMYRVSGDVWDSWEDVAPHFDISKDFASSRMLGGEGLMGRSWPDLDMLPLGRLTDPGSDQGPHRTSRLSVDEARSMMTLWSISKSPLMVGGDMRYLDNITQQLLTNPTITEINSLSSGNTDFFPHFTSVREEERGARADRVVIRLVGCGQETNTTDIWYVEKGGDGGEVVCLRDKVGGDSLRMYKKVRNGGEFYLLSTKKQGVCLDSRLRWKGTVGGYHIMFSLCREHASQLWEMGPNGTLESSQHHGLCAAPDRFRIGDDVRTGNGIRSWVATLGREIYVAFFNLNERRRVMSMNISDLGKVVPSDYLNGTCCRCREVWEEKEIDVRNGSITTLVEVHGCVLLILSCS